MRSLTSIVSPMISKTFPPTTSIAIILLRFFFLWFERVRYGLTQLIAVLLQIQNRMPSVRRCRSFDCIINHLLDRSFFSNLNHVRSRLDSFHLSPGVMQHTSDAVRIYTFSHECDLELTHKFVSSLNPSAWSV